MFVFNINDQESHLVSIVYIKLTFHKQVNKQEEYIPVGCILPTCWPYLPAWTAWGVCLSAGIHPPGCGPGDPLSAGLETPPGVGLETPPGQIPQPPLGVGLETPTPGDLQGMLGYHPSSRDLQGMLGYHPPPQWTEWQTGAKILPSPKLHLRAVNIWKPYREVKSPCSLSRRV